MQNEKSNDSSAAGNGTPESQASHATQTTERSFTRVVEAVTNCFHPYRVDRATHIAHGLMIDRHGTGHDSTLAYDELAGVVAISIFLASIARLTQQQFDCLMRVQRQARLSRLDHDSENGTLVLRGSCLYQSGDDTDFMMQRVLKDLERVLSDDRLAVLRKS